MRTYYIITLENIILYIDPNAIGNKLELKDEYIKWFSESSVMNLVHPELYLSKIDYKNLSLKKVMKVIPSLFMRSIRAKIINTIKGFKNE
jgi:hypothetical protein